MPDNITNLKVGLGADLTQLDADLASAEAKIAALGDTPVKISISPDIDAKAFISQIQAAVAGQTVKVKVDGVQEKPGASGAGGAKAPSAPTSASAPTVTPNLDITDVSGKLDFFENRIEEIKQVSGNIDVDVRVDTNAMGEVTKGVITYRNALGQAQSETYKLVNVVDEISGEASREFQFVGESLAESSTKANKFNEDLRAVKNTLDTFANKNADIADQIGMDDLNAKFSALQGSTNAEVLAIQKFKNELGAAKVKVDEIRAAQKAQADAKRAESANQRNAEKQAAAEAAAMERQLRAESRAASQEETARLRQQRTEEQALAQEKASYEQSIMQLRSMSISDYRKQQEQITGILQKQLEITNRKIVAERSSSTDNKQVRAALQLQKATLNTTAYTARLSVYARDVAAQINKAKNSMSGMQGYARSTANIFKGIVLSQAFYRGLGAVQTVVKDAWELSKALNSAEATFSGMLEGGQAQAQSLLEVLKQEAISTPFNLDNLTQAARLLTAYGIKAENLMYVMRGVEKATAASGDPARMESISRALGQVYTKGKLMGEEVRQLTEAGIAVSDILTEELGLTQAELQKGWADLSIDANTAINAIVEGIDKRYGKALDNMAKTTEQKVSNLRESFALIASSLTDPIRRAIDSVIDVVTPKVEQLYQAIQAVGLGNALKTLIPPAVFNGVVTAIDRIIGAVQAIRQVFQQIQPVVGAVMGALKWYGEILYNIFISGASAVGMFGQAVGNSANGASVLEAGIKRLISALLVYKAVMLVIGAASKIWMIVSLMVRGVQLAVVGAIVAAKAMAATFSAAGLAGAAGFLPIIGVLLVIGGLLAALSGSLDSIVGAAKRVGSALKNLGGGTNLGSMFKDMSGSMQDSIDAYNDDVAKQNADMSKALTENSDESSDAQKDQAKKSASAADATKKAVSGLLSFDEVYKLNETGTGDDAGGAGGSGGGALSPLDIEAMPTIDFGGVFDGIGGLGDDLINALDLSELQSALGDLWTGLYPLLDDILIYGLKMMLYFKQMHMYAKLMTGENKEQWVFESAQTTQDQEQLAREQSQTTQDQEQLAREQSQTLQDQEQLTSEQLQTTQDQEQLKHEQLQTMQDQEQLAREQSQTLQDQEQLAREQSQTLQDQEQKFTVTRTDGSGGAGTKGTAAALGLINLAQLGMDFKLISDDIKDLRTDGATMSEWMSLFVNGLMAAVDVLGLFAAGKMLMGGLGKVAGGAAAGGAGQAAAGAAGKVAAGAAGGAAASAADSAAGSVGSMSQATSKLTTQLQSLIKNLALGIAVIAEVAVAAVLVIGAVWLIGKLLVEVGQAWQPVIDNGQTIVIAMGVGAGILATIGAVTAGLGSVGTDLIVNLGLGIAVLALIGAAAGLFIAEIWAIGKGLEQIGLAWQPVLDNGKNIAQAIGWGTAILLAIGAATAGLGVATVASAGALPLAIGLGTAMLLQLGIAAGLFITEIWAIGKGLEQIGLAWQPVLDNGDTIASGIKWGTGFLLAIGAAAAALGVATVASVGLLPVAIGLGTALLVQLTDSFITFTNSLVSVADVLSLNLAPSLTNLNAELPGLSDNMSRFTSFMEEFVGQVASYTKSTAIAGLSGMVDTIIGWFTQDPFERMANDVDKIYNQSLGLNNKLGLAIPELQYMKDMMSSYQTLMDEVSVLLNDNSNISLAGQMFVNLEEVGANLILGFAQGVTGNIGAAVMAMQGAFMAILAAEQTINGSAGGVSTVYTKEGMATMTGFAGGVLSSASTPLTAMRTVITAVLTATRTINGSLGGTSTVYTQEGTKAVTGFANGISGGLPAATLAAKTAFSAVLSTARAVNGSTGATSAVYAAEGAKVMTGFAGGINGKASLVKDGFKNVLNGMLGSMETFTERAATALNNMLGNFSTTMSNLAVNATTGNVNFKRMSGSDITRLADGGVVHRAARGVQMLRKPTKLASNVEAGEAGAEVVFPLQNTSFIKAFAKDIAAAVNGHNTQQSAQSLSAQVKQARSGAAQSLTVSTPSAEEISNAIRSWFTPQMQSLHDVLEQDRRLDVTVPDTSNALWRMVLSELKAVNASSGARGLQPVRG